MRDDIKSLPIPRQSKQLARLRGLAGMRRKQALSYVVSNLLYNRGRRVGNFDSRDAFGPVPHAFK